MLRFVLSLKMSFRTSEHANHNDTRSKTHQPNRGDRRIPTPPPFRLLLLTAACRAQVFARACGVRPETEISADSNFPVSYVRGFGGRERSYVRTTDTCGDGRYDDRYAAGRIGFFPYTRAKLPGVYLFIYFFNTSFPIHGRTKKKNKYPVLFIWPRARPTGSRQSLGVVNHFRLHRVFFPPTSLFFPYFFYSFSFLLDGTPAVNHKTT